MGLSWTGILRQVQWWCYFFDQVGKLRSEYPITRILQETLHYKSSCLYGSGSQLINKIISLLNLGQNSSSGEPHFIGSEDPKSLNFVAYFPVFVIFKIFINEPWVQTTALSIHSLVGNGISLIHGVFNHSDCQEVGLFVFGFFSFVCAFHSTWVNHWSGISFFCIIIVCLHSRNWAVWKSLWLYTIKIWVFHALVLLVIAFQKYSFSAILWWMEPAHEGPHQKAMAYM